MITQALEKRAIDLKLMRNIGARIAQGESLTRGDVAFITGIDETVRCLTSPYDNFINDFLVRRAVREYYDSKCSLRKAIEVKPESSLNRGIHDRNLVELIKDKIRNSQSLSREEIRFVYEIGRMIEGLNSDEYVYFRRDCLVGRNVKKDLLVAFDCLPEQIVDREEDVTENTVAVLDNLTEKSAGLISSRKNFLFVYGQANLNGSDDLTLISECVSFHEPSGFRNCNSLISVAGNFIGGADFRNCSSLSSVPGVFGRRSVFWNCPNLKSVSAEFNGNVSFCNCNSLSSISGMKISGEAGFTDSELSKKMMRELQVKWKNGEINKLFI